MMLFPVIDWTGGLRLSAPPDKHKRLKNSVTSAALASVTNGCEIRLLLNLESGLFNPPINQCFSSWTCENFQI